MRGPGTDTPLECVGDPRAGRVSEGRIHGTRSPSARTGPALVVTAMTPIGKPGDLGLSQLTSWTAHGRGRSHLSSPHWGVEGRTRSTGRAGMPVPGPNSPARKG
jgi:hypothetical protein